MATRAELISDIELRIYQGKPSDDVELEHSQIAHWIDMTRDSILTEKLNRAYVSRIGINPFYVTKEECLALTLEDSQCLEDCGSSRFYITLTGDVLPLIKDSGIIRISDNYGRSLAGTDQLLSESINNLPFYKTTTARQTFFRENNDIFISNSTESSAEIYKYNVYYVKQMSGSDISDSDDYPLEESLLPDLLDKVEEIARREMNLGISDQVNDGTDPYNDKN